LKQSIASLINTGLVENQENLENMEKKMAAVGLEENITEM
jgi:putative aldouronate transport system substrate-binding protein